MGVRSEQRAHPAASNTAEGLTPDIAVSSRRQADGRRHVDTLAQEKGCTSAQLALAWLIHQPGVTSPIVGPRTVDHLDDTLGAVTVAITDEDRERLDDVVAPEQAITSYYNGDAMDFGPSRYRW